MTNLKKYPVIFFSLPSLLRGSVYDSLGRLISQNIYNKEQLHNVNILNDEVKKVSRSYSYSKEGELLTIEDSLRGKTNYSYDRLGRVKETIKQNGSNETKELFAFDPAHNPALRVSRHLKTFLKSKKVKSQTLTLKIYESMILGFDF